jgi:hypothetical protein
MKKITIGLEETNEEIFTFDEALEIAAGTAKEKANLPSGPAPARLGARADRFKCT